MAKKKKLLAWCDFNVPTGFGVVSKNLFENLHKTYDTSIIGINYHGDTKYDTSKYFVYSVSRDDMLGIKRLPKILQKEDPDILFLFQDIFHISDIIDRLKETINPKTKIVVYFPVDGAPFSLAWGNVFDKADAIITYSDWAIKTIKDRFPSISVPIHKLYHGVNRDTFYPHNIKTILDLRKTFNWENKFTVININRFQPRKAIPITMRAFSMFAKGYKVCKCGNHMPLSNQTCDVNMCSIDDIIDEVRRDRDDVFLYLHMMPQEPTMGPSRANLLQNHLLNAGFVDADVNNIVGVNAKRIYEGEVSEASVNNIYNAANVNVSSSLGEGCGLSLLEAASTGTPSIAPKNSAIPEQLRGTGHLINNLGVMNQAMDNAHLRPIPDPWHMAELLEVEYTRWKKEADGGKKIRRDCIENIENNFLWKDKRGLLEKVLQESLINE
jgi:glycosyltransferase involved in cell wall biosynthesis